MTKSARTLSEIPEALTGELKPIPVQRPQEFIQAEFAMAKAEGEDYLVMAPAGNVVRLVRDTDFGIIPGVKAPTLFKSGAEKIATAFGLLQHYTIETSIEDFDRDDPYCFYRARCDLVKIGPNGQEYILSTGYGSANTREKRNGRNDAFNAANSTLKMATKRSLTAAALSISSMSGLFTQDMENEAFINDNMAALSATNREDAPINRKQMNLIYAKAGNLGLTAPQAKKMISDAGFPSIRELKQKDLQTVLDLFLTDAEKEALYVPEVTNG